MNAVTQEDIGMFQDMFSKLSNILVKASDLGAKIPELESQLSALSAESESVRKRNMELDEQLATVRSQRDEYQNQVNTVIASRNQIEADYQVVRAEADRVHAEANRLADELANAKTERDNYGMLNLDLADKLEAANAVIAKFKELLGSLSGPSTPEPVHVPSLDTLQPATITPVGEMSLGEHAVPTPTVKRIYRWEDNARFEHEFYTNNRTRQWDDTVHDYYVEVAA